MSNIMRKLLALTSAFMLTMSLVGCGVNVTGVSLDLPSTIERGDSIVATPEYAFDGETPETAEYEKKIDALGMEYTSSNPDVISVDENGNITALSIGTSEVAMKSSDGKISAVKTMEVVVTPTDIKMVENITLTESNNQAKLDVVVTPSDATHVKIDFTSSDENIASITDDGNVEAKAIGEATITASVEGTDLKAECYITVLPDVSEIELSDTSLNLTKGTNGSISYTVKPENAIDSGASFQSSDESVATVDSEGNVTAVSDGTATITVTVADISAECKVTVYTPTQKIPRAGDSAQNNGNGNTSNGTANSSQGSSAVTSSSFEYGAIPFSLANDDTWWAIDQSDSAYWAVLNNINAMRAAGGLSPLSANSSLDAIANSRCDYQLVNDTLSHSGAQTPEILAQSQKSASEVCTGWQNSPSHYAVIMNPNFTQIGICCYFEIGGKTIWCCTFG